MTEKADLNIYSYIIRFGNSIPKPPDSLEEKKYWIDLMVEMFKAGLC
jgi:hypothetical protein